MSIGEGDLQVLPLKIGIHNPKTRKPRLGITGSPIEIVKATLHCPRAANRQVASQGRDPMSIPRHCQPQLSQPCDLMPATLSCVANSVHGSGKHSIGVGRKCLTAHVFWFISLHRSSKELHGTVQVPQH